MKVTPEDIGQWKCNILTDAVDARPKSATTQVSLFQVSLIWNIQCVLLAYCPISLDIKGPVTYCATLWSNNLNNSFIPPPEGNAKNLLFLSIWHLGEAEDYCRTGHHRSHRRYYLYYVRHQFHPLENVSRNLIQTCEKVGPSNFLNCIWFGSCRFDHKRNFKGKKKKKVSKKRLVSAVSRGSSRESSDQFEEDVVMTTNPA